MEDSLGAQREVEHLPLLQVLAVHGGADGDIGDRLVHVLHLDFDARVPHPAKAGLASAVRGPSDHLRGRERIERVPVPSLGVEGPLAQLRMERALHARGIALEPSLEVVENGVDDGGSLRLRRSRGVQRGFQ